MSRNTKIVKLGITYANACSQNGPNAGARIGPNFLFVCLLSSILRTIITRLLRRRRKRVVVTTFHKLQNKCIKHYYT